MSFNRCIIKQFMDKVNGVVRRMMRFSFERLYEILDRKREVGRFKINPGRQNMLDDSWGGCLVQAIVQGSCIFRKVRQADGIQLMHRRVALMLLLSITMISGACFAGNVINVESKSGSAPEFYPGLGGDFDLQGIEGNQRFSALQGDWKLLGFGFSHCPNICSMLLSKMNQVVQKSSAKPEQLGAVFISVDTKRDSSEEGLKRLQAFVGRFNDQFVALSGPEEAIAKVTKQYAVYYSSEQDTINHTDRIYLLNAQGNVKKIYSRAESVATMVADLKDLL